MRQIQHGGNMKWADGEVRRHAKEVILEQGRQNGGCGGLSHKMDIPFETIVSWAKGVRKPSWRLYATILHGPLDAVQIAWMILDQMYPPCE